VRPSCGAGQLDPLQHVIQRSTAFTGAYRATGSDFLVEVSCDTQVCVTRASRCPIPRLQFDGPPESRATAVGVVAHIATPRKDGAEDG
jgi:hypothetical protein